MQTIKNPRLIPILINWIPELQQEHQLLLLDHLNQLVPSSIFNQHQCCKEGVIEVILDTLGSSQSNEGYLGTDVEGVHVFLFFFVVVCLYVYVCGQFIVVFYIFSAVVCVYGCFLLCLLFSFQLPLCNINIIRI